MLLLLFLHPFVLSMVLVDTIINKIATYFHKTISSNKLPSYIGRYTFAIVKS